jgi:hypothetical protein
MRFWPTTPGPCSKVANDANLPNDMTGIDSILSNNNRRRAASNRGWYSVHTGELRCDLSGNIVQTHLELIGHFAANLVKNEENTLRADK